MTLLNRWCRFNLVGVLGVGVQLSILAALTRLWPVHYLVNSGAAVEVTLLHNFAWHRRFTWGDRGADPAILPLLRFHLSNGLVSLLGTLVLMRLLVHTVHLPVLPANLIAIAACSTLNFSMSHMWAFAGHPLPVTSTLRGNRIE